jgi:hypothetical protein
MSFPDASNPIVFFKAMSRVFSLSLAAGRKQLWLILGDGVNQAADLASGATSIPSWNLTPWMTFGNWF